jgi:hypothetical protein
MQRISRSGLLWPVLVAIACAEGETLTDDGDGAAKGGSSAGGAPSFGGSTSGGATGSGGKSSSGGAATGGAKASGGASNGGAKTSGGASSGGATGGGNSIFTGAPSCNGPQGGSGGGTAGAGSGGASPGGASSGGVGDAGGAAGTSGGGAGGDGGAGGAGGASFAAPGGGTAASASAGATGSAGAGGTGVAAAFCDDFEDGDAGGWTPEVGSWAITSDDSLTLEGGPTESMAIAADTTFADQIVEARIKVLSFPSSSSSYRAGLIARYTGGSNFYSLSLAGNGRLRVLHGNSTVSGCSDFAANVVAGTWYTLRFEVTGPANSVKLSAFIDGKPAQTCTLTSNTEVSGSAGVFTYGDNTSALFDQVLVYAP